MIRKVIVALVMSLLIASAAGPARAEPSEITAKEWQYLQRIGLIVKVGETVWDVFDESKGWNRDLTEHARELTRLNLSMLKSSLPPAPELQEIHWQMVEGLEMSVRFYDEAAQANFGRARDVAEEIKKKMVEIEAAWRTLEGRYPESSGSDGSD
jgi:hypothetical protein